MADAFECDYIAKNPTRRATLPRCEPQKETRSLSEAEVRRLIETSTGRDRIWWQILLLTGLRIGEMLALTVEDLLPIGLQISKSALQGKAGSTKNKKTRIVPLAPELRKDLERWAESVGAGLLFPTETGGMFWRQSETVKSFIGRGRVAAKIPDLKPRMFRTTFATLSSGDPTDIQGHRNLKMTMDVKPEAGFRAPAANREGIRSARFVSCRT
jgi:integrase